MNDYQKYKLKQSFHRLIEGFFDVIFYIPRKLYKENDKFKKFIMSGESKSYKKKKIKRCLARIFYDLDNNASKTCVVYTNSRNDYWYDNIDIADYDYKILLEDDKWISKNKLTVEKKKFYDYIKETQPEYLYSVYEHRKDDVIMIIKRL